MGDSSLEARLRARLVLVLAPTLTAVGVAAMAVTARALDAADDDRARALAHGVAETLRAELAEGDAFADAAREAMTPFDPRQIRFAIDPAPGASPLTAIPFGRCASIEMDGGSWRACAVKDEGAHVIAALRTDARRDVLRSLATWLSAVVLLALAGAFAATRVALRAPLRALARLVAWAEKVSRGEDAEPPREGTTEIARLARAFEALVAQLVDAVARERAASAHIAHELRTPLTAVVAELDALDPSERVLRLRADAARLARVIDAILLLSGPPAAARADTVVNVADVARRLAPRGAKVDAPDEALVEAEPHLVELALFNLLDNAAKYAPGGARSVRVAREADAVRISVIDDGPGLPDAARARVFDRYWREAEGGEGRGLGLALVRAVAERHGGEASVRDAPDARGVDIGFTLAPVLAWHQHEAPADAR